MRVTHFAVATAAVFAMMCCGCSDSGTGPDVRRDTAPAAEASPATPAAAADTGMTSEPIVFELGDMNGTRRQSSEWDGRPRLLNFWATWCAPCRREIPLLKQTQDEYGESLDLQVIGIAVDRLEDVVAYAEEAEFNYPILVGELDAMEVAESSGVEFIGLPFTLIVSPSGELIKPHIGEIKDEHIVEITTVFAQMARGELDLDGARAALGTL